MLPVLRIRDLVFFWIPGIGSGMEKNPGSEINILDHISESLRIFLGLKILEFFFNSVLRIRIRDGKIQIRDPE
jgi:hypothetical protein